MLSRTSSRRIKLTLLAIVCAAALLGQGLHLFSDAHGGLGSCRESGSAAHATEHRCPAHTHHTRAEHQPGDRSDQHCQICQFLALVFLAGPARIELTFSGGVWLRLPIKAEPADSVILFAYSGRAPPSVL
jgi:hypothetical protein